MRDDEQEQMTGVGDAARWLRIDAVFSALLELPPEARDAAVDGHCGGDPELAAAVRRLLRAERRSAGVFDAAAASVHALADEALLAADDQTLPESVRQIGPYRLTRRLGAGGMSVVWKAERNDGEFQQTVAVKLLRRWIESEESVQRFRAERRILAGLEHANLARLLDGGVVADGWPYFILEYVDGEPITDYCDRWNLTVEQRLALLDQVLGVVQYAHRRLVVHRDLKPSNILVTAAGQVKLLDFGIAKVLEDEAGVATASDLTVAGGRLLTPAFASPEQIAGGSVSTATDVYAIGVLLYHLLTGRSPYRVDGAQPARLQEAVLAQTPPNPSVRVLDADGPADEADRLARLRATTSARLARTLRGDLDVICQVALRKEPEHRYASVEQLAADLERYRQRRPVLARSGNWRYRTGRFARRHAWALAAGIGLPATLVAALLLHTDRLGAERDRATAAAVRAEHEAERASQVTGYLVELFRAADPAQSGGREVTAVELVDRGIERTDTLADDPALQAAMLRVLGQVSQALGRYQRADDVLVRALSNLDRVDDAVGVRRGDVLADLGYTSFQLGRLEDAEQYNRRALAALPVDDLAGRAPVLTNLGIVAIMTSRYEEATALLEEAAAAHRITAPGSPDHAATLNALGTLLSRQARHQEAVETLEQAVAMRVEQFGDLHPATSVARGNLGIVLLEAGDPAAGEKHLLQALAVDEQVLGPDHPSLAVLLNQVANARRVLGDARGAIDHLVRALAILRRQHAADSPPIAAALSGLGSAHLRLGEFTVAAAYLSEATAIEERTLGPTSRELAIDLVQLGAARLGEGRIDDAAALFDRALGIGLELFGEHHEIVGNALMHRARLYWQRGDAAQAADDAARSADVLAAVFGADRAEVQALRAWLADSGRGGVARPPPLPEITY